MWRGVSGLWSFAAQLQWTSAAFRVAGTTASRFSSPSCASTSCAAGVAGAAATSATGPDGRSDAKELEDLPRAVGVGVLIEHAFARTTSHSFGGRRIGE